ncbi:MAG: hypothetical protein ACKVOE_10325 [Rickettsiales bacterium]
MMDNNISIASRNLLQQLANLPLHQLLMEESIAPTGKMLVEEYRRKLTNQQTLQLPEGDVLQRVYLDYLELSALYDFSTQLVNIPKAREMAILEVAGDTLGAGKMDESLLRDETFFDGRGEILNELGMAIRSYSGDYRQNPRAIARELRENLEDIFPGDFDEGIDHLAQRSMELRSTLHASEDCRAIDVLIQQFLIRQAIPRMNELMISMRLAIGRLSPGELHEMKPGVKAAAPEKPGFPMNATTVKGAAADPNNQNVVDMLAWREKSR